jgi:hypothetical protein
MQAQSLQPYVPEAEEDVIEQAPETIAKGLRDEIASEFFPTYKSEAVAKAPPKDTLNNQFVIQLNQPLPDLNTTYAKAYVVIDKENNAKQLMGMVCSNQMPPRIKLARQLLKNQHANLLPLVASGIVRLSKPDEERFIIVYERPKGKSLAAILAEQIRPLPERFIIERIIGPLAAAINHLDELGFTHGRVNANNVFFGEQVMLGECCAEPCGVSQDFHFEPLGRLQVLPPTGKGEGAIQNDYHALGALVTLLKFKPKIFQDPDQPRVLNVLLQEGAYIGLVGYRDLTEEMSDFLRGCLHDSPYERWTYKQIKQWLGGKRYNLLPPSLPTSGSRAFQFMEQNFINLRTLSTAMQANWALATTPLRDNSLSRWVEVGMRRKDIADSIARTVKSLGGSYNRTEKQNNELVARALTLMDPIAPIRMKHVSCFIEGIGLLLADCYVRKDDASIALISDLIEQGMPSIWTEAQRRYLHQNEKLPEEMQSKVQVIDRARMHMRSNGIGFGIERTLYDLNPDMPCMSPLLNGYYVIGVDQLLIALDSLAPRMAAKEAPIDRHIAAYIASRLNITKDQSFVEFRGYPDLQKHKALLALKFLQQAQIRSGNMKLPGLTAWIVTSITEVLSSWQSKSIREHVCKNLKHFAFRGHLTPILDFFVQYDYTASDRNGFLQASASYHNMANEIIHQQDEFKRELRAVHYGSMIAKGLSYIIFIGVMFYFFSGE